MGTYLSLNQASCKSCLKVPHETEVNKISIHDEFIKADIQFLLKRKEKSLENIKNEQKTIERIEMQIRAKKELLA